MDATDRLEQIASGLAASFLVEEVRWRIGSGPYFKDDVPSAKLLAYIDARQVQDRLDMVVGAWNWQTEMVATQDGVVCRLGIRGVPEGEFVWKSDGAQYTAIESFKGGCSEALRRAAAEWGIGRYLYGFGDLPKSWSYSKGNKKRLHNAVSWQDKKTNVWWSFPPPALETWPRWAVPETQLKSEVDA